MTDNRKAFSAVPLRAGSWEAEEVAQGARLGSPLSTHNPAELQRKGRTVKGGTGWQQRFC